MITFFMVISLFNGACVVFYLHKKMSKFNETAIETQGKIVDLQTKTEKDSDGEKRVLYATVTFDSLMGLTTVEKTLSNDTFQVGDAIAVFYNPNNTEEATFVEKHNTKVLLVVSAIMLLISAGLTVYNWKECIEDYHRIPEFFYIGTAMFGFGIISVWIAILKKKP